MVLTITNDKADGLKGAKKTIQAVTIQSTICEPYENYKHMYVDGTKEIQFMIKEIKALKIKDAINVTVYPTYIKYTAIKQGVSTYDRDFGYVNKRAKALYKTRLNFQQLLPLSKISGLSPNINIHVADNDSSPFKFVIPIGNMGSLSIYIKPLENNSNIGKKESGKKKKTLKNDDDDEFELK